MAGLAIGEVARRAGLRPSALRYYEQAGLIAAQPRSGGRRQYDASVFNVLAVIDFAKRAGFSVAEIRVLLSGFGPAVVASTRWRAMARRKQRELNGAIADAHRMKSLLRAALKCRCMTLDECGRRFARPQNQPRNPNRALRALVRRQPERALSGMRPPASSGPPPHQRRDECAPHGGRGRREP